MVRWYFVYGADQKPFNAGWAEVEAPDAQMALDAFQVVHPAPDGSDVLMCYGAYPEGSSQSNGLIKYGNNGKFCVERIKLTVEII